MPQSQPQSSSSSQRQEALQDQSGRTGQAQAEFAERSDSLDSLLDDIESTLETNAEEYVSRFVQKGGQ